MPSSTETRRGSQISLAALLVVVLLALFGPLLSPYESNIPSGDAYLAPLSGGHLLGTDNLGFDLLTRVLEARASACSPRSWSPWPAPCSAC